MRLAVFTPYLPYPPDTGGKIRSYYLLHTLAQRFEVDLFVPYHGTAPADADIAAMKALCRQVYLLPVCKSWRTRDRLARTLTPLPRSVDYFFTPDTLTQARTLLAKENYALLIADEICMTPYAQLAPDLPGIVGRQKVDHLHYREMARARRWGTEKLLDFTESLKLRRYEQAAMPFYQAAVVCSEQDRAIIRRDAPDIPYRVIPNGVNLSTFVPAGMAKTSKPTLLYVGSMHYYPNIDAVQFFFQAMYQSIREYMPDVRVQIVGCNPLPEIRALASLPGVEVFGDVPDVRPYYEQATALIVPLRLGGGTRLKIVEAMAMGLPVVSTLVGAEGLAIHPGENILIADDPAAFIAAVQHLLTDASRRQHIAEGGRRLAQHYDWGVLSQPLVELVETVVYQREGVIR